MSTVSEELSGVGIMCCTCGARPEDCWDDDPEGFVFVLVDPARPTYGDWYCEECDEEHNKQDGES